MVMVVRSSLYAQIRDRGYWSATGCGISPLNSAIKILIVLSVTDKIHALLVPDSPNYRYNTVESKKSWYVEPRWTR